MRGLDQRRAVIACGVFSVLLAFNCARYYPFIADDAFISLRYAARVLAGHGLTWSSGAPVEGYSNLLWVLATAALGMLGFDGVVAVRALGVTCMVLTAWVLSPWRRIGAFVPSGWCVYLPMALLACSAPIAVWTIGGLEQPLVALLLAFALTRTFQAMEQDAFDLSRRALKAAQHAGLALGLLCWTRPDSPIFVLATTLSVLGVQWRRGAIDRRVLAWLTLLPASFVLAQSAFRLAYYDAWWPNTALAKVALTEQRVFLGVRYVLGASIEHWPLTLLSMVAVIVGLRDRTSRTRVTVLASNAAAWCLYLSIIGGDIFPARRQLVPLIVLMTLTLIEVLNVIEARADARQIVAWRSGVIGAALLSFVLGPLQPSSRAAIDETWERDGLALGRYLRKRFGDDALIAVTAAGSVAYASGLDAIDMLGLNDRYLAQHPPAHFGRGEPGHELGDARYVLGRKPDVIVFHTGSEPLFFIGQALQRDPEFLAQYRPERFGIGSPRVHQGVYYVRKRSPRRPSRDDFTP